MLIIPIEIEVHNDNVGVAAGTNHTLGDGD